jgi:hypothetical protein
MLLTTLFLCVEHDINESFLFHYATGSLFQKYALCPRSRHSSEIPGCKEASDPSLLIGSCQGWVSGYRLVAAAFETFHI